MTRRVKFVFVFDVDSPDYELDDALYESAREYNPECLIKAYWVDYTGVRHYDKGRWSDPDEP